MQKNIFIFSFELFIPFSSEKLLIQKQPTMKFIY